MNRRGVSTWRDCVDKQTLENGSILLIGTSLFTIPERRQAQVTVQTREHLLGADDVCVCRWVACHLLVLMRSAV